MTPRPGERVTVNEGELCLGARRLPLLSGEVHFFRTEPNHWDDLLARAAEAGLPIVATYLSWRRHEPRPGAPDLAGTSDSRLDVRRFIERCAAHGVLVHLKPGPWICAEEESGGYPDWLLEDRDLWALDAAGVPILGYNPPWQHRVPSYLHPRYLAHVRRWLRAVDRRLAGLFYPEGPIVLIQLDNEPSYAFADTPLGFDYHPVVIERYRRWLLRRYGSLGGIGRAWGAANVTAEALEPPRSPEQEPSRRGLDWIEFREWLIAEYLRRLRRYHEAAGVGGALFTANYNDHPIASVPQDGWRIARAIGGTGGPDCYYVPPLTDPDVERLARSVALARANDRVLPWAPEIQAGIWRTPGQPTPDPTPDELEFWWLAAIAFGLRGLNLYMLADRENWADAPLRADGSPGALWPAVKRLSELFGAMPWLGTLVPISPVALYRDQASWRRSYLLMGSSAGADDASSPVAAWNHAFRVLLRAGYLPAVWDSRSRVPLGTRSVVVTGPAERSPQLRRFAELGGTVLELGTRSQESGSRKAPGHATARVASVESLPSILRRAGIAPPVTLDHPNVVPVLSRGDGTEILFLVCGSSLPASLSVRFADKPKELTPIMAGPGWNDHAGPMHLAARSVRVFRVRDLD